MRRLAFWMLLFGAMELGGCASVESFPQRRCLFFGDRRFDAGSVVAKRDDGARLFKFDDSSKGDRGYRWVTDDDAVKIRPCPTGSDQQGIGRFGAETNAPPEVIPTP